MIKVILRKDVEGVAKAGVVIGVKDGFARNYLLPQNLALLATESNLKQIEAEKKRRQTRKTVEKKEAQALAERLQNFSVTITVEVNQEEQMYGSLGVADIVKAIAQEGISIDKKCILLEVPIKDLGIYDVEVNLHPEVSAKIKVWVVKS